MVVIASMRTLDGWLEGHWRLQQDIGRLTYVDSDLGPKGMIRRHKTVELLLQRLLVILQQVIVTLLRKVFSGTILM
jgi:hypothetical protein